MDIVSITVSHLGKGVKHGQDRRKYYAKKQKFSFEQVTMHHFNKSNKVSSILWLKSELDRFTFRIKLKPREGIVTCPNYYNEYSHTSEIQTQQTSNTNEISEYTFKWQEKVFSRWEFNHYGDINNCILEKEKDYYNMIQNNDHKICQMFTYIHQDTMIPMPELCNNKKNNILDLICFSKLNINSNIGLLNNEIANSTKHLFESEQDLHTDDEQWVAMQIIWDNSEYNEDSQVLFKEECVLLSLYYNTAKNYLMMSPSENDIGHSPYTASTDTGVLGFEYSVMIEENEKDMGELVSLLNKLKTKLEKKQRSVLNFTMPSQGKIKTFVNFEIVSAKDFYIDNMYIEVNVKIPDKIECTGDVHARTHVSRALQTEDMREWMFGHMVDLELEYAIGFEPPPLVIYLEAISTDWWGRHRTEGYGHLTLSMSPGKYSANLLCRRPEELDKREAELRRFFVGGCHLIKDLRVLDQPQDYDANLRYVTTGDILVRWNTISQTRSPGTSPPAPHGSASRLLQGADAVLRQYKRAKATLAAATQDLDIIHGSGDG